MGQLAVSLGVPSEPFNGGHIVLRLNKPIYELSFDELAHVKKIIDRVIQVEKTKIRPEGFNIYISDMEISIIPRWCGDINVAFFGGLKIVPMSSEDVKRVIIDSVYEHNT